MATNKQNPTYLRVLQHDRSDEIRIGVAFCAIGELDKAEQECIKTYEENAPGVVDSVLRAKNTTSVLPWWMLKPWRLSEPFTRIIAWR